MTYLLKSKLGVLIFVSFVFNYKLRFKVNKSVCKYLKYIIKQSVYDLKLICVLKVFNIKCL